MQEHHGNIELTLLGTGCPSVDINRFGPANLVDGGVSSRLLVDCGTGVTQRLLEAGCSGGELDAILITHLHSDHFSPELLNRCFAPKGIYIL